MIPGWLDRSQSGRSSGHSSRVSGPSWLSFCSQERTSPPPGRRTRCELGGGEVGVEPVEGVAAHRAVERGVGERDGLGAAVEDTARARDAGDRRAHVLERLDGHDLEPRGQQRARQLAGARAEVEDPVAGTDAELGDDPLDDRGRVSGRPRSYTAATSAKPATSAWRSAMRPQSTGRAAGRPVRGRPAAPTRDEPTTGDRGGRSVRNAPNAGVTQLLRTLDSNPFHPTRAGRVTALPGAGARRAPAPGPPRSARLQSQSSRTQREHPHGDRGRHQGAAGGRGPLRPSDAPLEPEDAPLHPRRALGHLHHRPAADAAAAQPGAGLRHRAGPPRRHDPLRRHEEAGARRRQGGRRERRHAVREQPLARRPAHELPDHQPAHPASARPRALRGRRPARAAADARADGRPGRPREAAPQPRRREEHAAHAGRRVHHRPQDRGDRRARGPAPAHPDHRPRRHQLRPGRHRLRHPRQRRRDPLVLRRHPRDRRPRRRGHVRVPRRGGPRAPGGRGGGAPRRRGARPRSRPRSRPAARRPSRRAARPRPPRPPRRARATAPPPRPRSRRPARSSGASSRRPTRR